MRSAVPQLHKLETALPVFQPPHPSRRRLSSQNPVNIRLRHPSDPLSFCCRSSAQSLATSLCYRQKICFAKATSSFNHLTHLCLHAFFSLSVFSPSRAFLLIQSITDLQSPLISKVGGPLSQMFPSSIAASFLGVLLFPCLSVFFYMYPTRRPTFCRAATTKRLPRPSTIQPLVFFGSYQCSVRSMHSWACPIVHLLTLVRSTLIHHALLCLHHTALLSP